MIWIFILFLYIEIIVTAIVRYKKIKKRFEEGRNEVKESYKYMMQEIEKFKDGFR